MSGVHGSRSLLLPILRYANPNASVAERLRFIANADLALLNDAGRTRPPTLGLRQRTQLREWSRGLASGEITEAEILNGRTKTGQPGRKPVKGAMRLDTLESTIDTGLREQFRHRLALATGIHVVSVITSDNVGDQAADLQAQLAGRPRAYSFVTETADGQRVQFDDFDFGTGQPIESKSIAALVPPGAPRDVVIKGYTQQMEKEARAARDNGLGPVKWLVPPDVDLDLVDNVYRRLPPEIRQHIYIPSRPAAPIR